VEIEGRVVVVTGGASGIGRALANAFAAAGAKGVVVADLNGDGATDVAAALPSAITVRTDVANEADVVALVRAAEEAYGPVDIFCANAGIFELGGVEVSDEKWQRIWAVNVLSHIYAARAVLPSMLERGEGYLVHTASAAGLLTQLGSAPYAVTKHAAVALAEWLSITHGDAGIRVSCLCPQGVWTGMTGAIERDQGEVLGSTAGRDGMLEPEQVADDVLAAIREERFLVLPHPEVATYELRRAGDRERWLRGMRRVQAAVAESLTPAPPPSER
jgi:NAD(P)-dependent dehydrogenase (short-subunit alcohol dehydrogenase family)